MEEAYKYLIVFVGALLGASGILGSHVLIAAAAQNKMYWLLPILGILGIGYYVLNVVSWYLICDLAWG